MRNFTNYLLWNPTILRLCILANDCPLEHNAIKKLFNTVKDCEWINESIMNNYMEYLSFDGRVPDVENEMRAVIEPIMGIYNFAPDFICGLFLTEQASNKILDCMDEIENATADSKKSFKYMCYDTLLMMINKAYKDARKDGRLDPSIRQSNAMYESRVNRYERLDACDIDISLDKVLTNITWFLLRVDEISDDSFWKC